MRSRLLSRIPRRALVPKSGFLPFAEWLPDLPDRATVTNVVPKSATSYGPFAAPAAYSTALTARCQGSYTVQDTTASAQVFAGDATKLYLLTTSAGTTFADVSKVGGYTTGGVPDGFWSITSFGQRVIATNYLDAAQTYLIGTDATFSDLGGGAPKAKFAAVVKDFLFFAYTNDTTNGKQPQRIQWSAVGDPENFPTPGTDAAIELQSDEAYLQQTDLGPITGLVGGHLASADGAVFCERGIYAVRYVGPPVIFSTLVVEGAAGTLSPLSLVPARNTTGGPRSVIYYVGQDYGFYAFDGAVSIPIGEQKVNDFFAGDIDPTYAGFIVGGSDPASRLVYWFYSAASSGGLLNRAICYHTMLGRFTYIDLTNHPLEYVARSLSLGVTLEGLDAFGNMDTLAFSLDSRVWIGGSPNFAVFDNAHKLAYLSGSNLAPTVETSETQFASGRRARVTMTRPRVDGGTPSVSVGVRDRLVDSVTYGTAVAMNALGSCPQHTTGRYARGRLTLPAASTFTHLEGIDFEAAPEGIR